MVHGFRYESSNARNVEDPVHNWLNCRFCNPCLYLENLSIKVRNRTSNKVKSWLTPTPTSDLLTFPVIHGGPDSSRKGTKKRPETPKVLKHLSKEIIRSVLIHKTHGWQSKPLQYPGKGKELLHCFMSRTNLYCSSRMSCWPSALLFSWVNKCSLA